jgi:hypothetical protein
MKITIPEIGSKIKLTEDWYFKLYHSNDNQSLFQTFEPTYKFIFGVTKGYIEAKIPKGTILSFDNLYLSKGSGLHNSLKFSIPKRINKNNPLGGAKFHAPLIDSNTIEYEMMDCNQDTLSLASRICNTVIKLSDGNISKADGFIKLIIGGTTGINSYRPLDEPTVFLKKAIVKLKKFKQPNYYYYQNPSEFNEVKTELISILEADFRKIKIQNIVER